MHKVVCSSLFDKPFKNIDTNCFARNKRTTNNKLNANLNMPMMSVVCGRVKRHEWVKRMVKKMEETIGQTSRCTANKLLREPVNCLYF